MPRLFALLASAVQLACLVRVARCRRVAGRPSPARGESVRWGALLVVSALLALAVSDVHARNMLAETGTGEQLSVVVDRTHGVINVRVEGSEALAAAPRAAGVVRWRWHFASSAGGVASSEWSHRDGADAPTALRAPDGATALELVLEWETEDGLRRLVRVEDLRTREEVRTETIRIDTNGPEPSSSLAVGDTMRVRGRVVFGDRVFDRAGYTGQVQRLPARSTRVEWRLAANDSLLLEGSTDAEGNFDLRLPGPLAPTTLELVTIRADSGAGPVSVVDAAGLAHRIVLASLAAAVVDTTFGDLEVSGDGVAAPAGAVHLLDLAGDALGLLETSGAGLGWPGGIVLPEIRWDPSVADASTRFDGVRVVVASPASGSSDAFSDGAVLTAIGHALLAPFGAAVPSDWIWEDLPRSAPDAFARATGWVFAGAVQQWRARERVDASGAALASEATVLVDLPSPPPAGFPATAEAAFELEAARVDPGDRAPVARGQLGAAVLATVMHDLRDGAADPDTTLGVDDDGIEGDDAAWLTALAATWAAAGQPVYEDFHAAWTAAAGGLDAELALALAVDDAGCALEIDPFESDDAVEDASVVVPWAQPPLVAAGVVVNEIFVGDRDGVELANRGSQPVDVGGWTITARRNGFAVTPQRIFTVPAPRWLLPGRQLLVMEGAPNVAASEFDLAAPNWQAPWAPDEDGAVILADATGVAVDFVRWDGRGGADRSFVPIPAGTTFVGRVIVPADVRVVLARDALATDTDRWTDFVARTPTPGWPNASDPRAHTLRPRGDVDHVDVRASGRFEVHARRDRDTGAPRLTPVVASGPALAAVRSGVGADATGAYVAAWTAVADTQTVLRLDTVAPAPTSTGVTLFAWTPASDYGVWPVQDLDLRPLGLDVVGDSVRVQWTARGRTDSFRVRVGGVPVDTVAGTVASTTIWLPIGDHVVSVEPFLPDRVGPARTAGIFVGPVPCAVQEDFEVQAGIGLDTTDGFTATDGPAFTGQRALRDAPPGVDYPVDDVATAEFFLPIDLTADATLRFVHACHLVADGDLATVEISVDNGATWSVLASYDGSRHPLGAGDPADWEDGVFTEGDWVQETILLGAYAGERARLRLRRESNGAGTSLGWWIDALSVDLGGAQGEYWIGVDGSDVIGCGLRDRPYATIAPALARVAPGERIVFGAGRHVRTVATPDSTVEAIAPLPRGVDLFGLGPDHTVLAPPAGAIAVIADGAGPATSTLRLRGLRVEGGAIGLRLRDLRAEIDSVQVVGADTAAVLLRSRAYVADSVLARGEVGLRADSTHVELQRSTLADLGVGVWFPAAGDSLLATRSLLGRSSQALVRASEAGAFVSIECSGVFANAVLVDGGGELRTLANRDLDPQHCDPERGVYTLARSSPYLSHPWCQQVGALGEGCVAPGVTAAPSLRAGVHFASPAPNPFNPRVSLRWEQSREDRVRLEVFDLRGRRVRVLQDGVLPGGRHEVVWEGVDANGRAVSSGVYLVRLRVDGADLVQRVALVR